jgi:hypothetical protein
MSYHGALFNVGPLTSRYSGVHTYSDVLFPFVKALKQYDVEFTWVGITLQNSVQNKTASDIGGTGYTLDIRNDVKISNQSWDMLDVEQFDFLLCQPRPHENKLERQILFTLIDKFVAAGKPVFVWEQDMFLGGFEKYLDNDNVILLHPALLPPADMTFKNQHLFPFFTYEPSKYDNMPSAYRIDYKDGWYKRKIPFIFIGNIYYRENQAMRFFDKMKDWKEEKVVFGSWLRTKERREFSQQFESFKFYGSCNHNLAVPLMHAANSTLHILPDFAMDRGLMTARVFTSQMAHCLCFCDSKIYGADQFFPPELLVKDGKELAKKYKQYINKRSVTTILAKRDELMKDHTVENRAYQFVELLRHYA